MKTAENQITLNSVVSHFFPLKSPLLCSCCQQICSSTILLSAHTGCPESAAAFLKKHGCSQSRRPYCGKGAEEENRIFLPAILATCDPADDGWRCTDRLAVQVSDIFRSGSMKQDNPEERSLPNHTSRTLFRIRQRFQTKHSISAARGKGKASAFLKKADAYKPAQAA